MVFRRYRRRGCRGCPAVPLHEGSTRHTPGRRSGHSIPPPVQTPVATRRQWLLADAHTPLDSTERSTHAGSPAMLARVRVCLLLRQFVEEHDDTIMIHHVSPRSCSPRGVRRTAGASRPRRRQDRVACRLVGVRCRCAARRRRGARCSRQRRRRRRVPTRRCDG